jgi:hypothetical protein
MLDQQRAPRVWGRGCGGPDGTRRANVATSRWDISVPGKEDKIMSLLWVLAVVFFVLWMLGFAAFHVTSGFIHILLLLAVIAVVFRLVTGRRTA